TRSWRVAWQAVPIPSARPVPARPGADRHVLDHKPPGVSSFARVSSTRADRARPMATQPHHPWGCWIFARRAALLRSNNVVTSTTEQHAALPYQGSARRRAMAERSGPLWVDMWVGLEPWPIVQ